MADSTKIATKVIHAGQQHEPITGAVMQPVFQTSTYAQSWPAKHTGYEYARTHNPTREALERNIAALENGTHGVAFGSGLGATTALLQTLPGGAKVFCCDDMYGGTFRLFTKIFSKHGMQFEFADLAGGDPNQIPEGTDLVWIETPSNPLLKCIDIAAVAARCKAIGARLAVDNTFATPVFQRPLELGADYVVHSTTKYLNGHSDVVGGIVLVRSDALHDELRFVQNAAGAVPGPWDCFLTLRGLKTLDVRMRRHQENAVKILAWVDARSDVKRVYYPLRYGNKGAIAARKQMSGFGGMISVVFDWNLQRAEAFVAATKLFTLAESLGGVESLVELPASMTHASVPPEARAALGIEDGLVRFSVGIEDADDLIADLEQAIAASAG